MLQEAVWRADSRRRTAKNHTLIKALRVWFSRQLRKKSATPDTYGPLVPRF